MNTSATTTTTTTTLPVDPALWEHIVRLLPMDKTVNNVAGPAHVLDTVELLARQSDDGAVHEQLAPSNEPLWRYLILQCFDFAVSPTFAFNVDSQGDLVYYTEHDHEMIMAIDEYNLEQRILSGRDENDDDGDKGIPGKLLVEDLQYWPHLGVAFRPIQFGFLGRIQCGATTIENAWPVDEDAHTLFRELAMMKRAFPQFSEKLHTPSDGVHAVFLSKMDAAISGRGFPLLKHCGFTPHFWNCAKRAVGRTWSGLTGGSTGRQLSGEIAKIFPMCSAGVENEIQDVVVEWCSDWRHVRVNPEECSSPAFYIGKSKQSTRWLGFVGQRDY